MTIRTTRWIAMLYDLPFTNGSKKWIAADEGKEKVKRLSNSFLKLNKAEDKRRLKSMERIWVQYTPKIHALNYLYYRYFTNEFELCILDSIKFVQTDKVKPSKKK